MSAERTLQGVKMGGDILKPTTEPVYRMLVEARDVEDSEEEVPTRKPPRSPLRVRSGLDEEYSSDEIAKMTLLYEGTLSNIEEGEIVKSRVLRVTDTAPSDLNPTSRMTAVSVTRSTRDLTI